MIFTFIEDMKLKNIYTTLCLSALAVVSCSKDEPVLPGRTATGGPFAITVTDGGYANADAPATRAVENGYTTEFTQGDACGLYIVRNGNIVESNLMLIAETSSSTGGELVWKVRDSGGNDVNLYYAPDYRYFVYYPYQIDMTDKVNASASDEASFFAPLINGWQLLSDQSDYKTGYTASDLMTAASTVSGKDVAGKRTLTFSMTHRMALVVVDMPKTVYKFTNTAPAIPDYTVRRTSSAQFAVAACPYAFPDGTYRYLINPASGAKLSATYNDGLIHRFDIDIATSALASGSYRTYKVDGGTIVKRQELQVGTFFLADGNLLPKDADAATVQTAKVVGIVFQTDPSRIGNAEKNKLGEGNVHGLVMSVKNAATDQRWGPYGKDEGLTKCTTKAQNYNDISGYGNCKHIRNTRGSFADYPAFLAANDYNTTCPVPAATTGWFLPSSGQWWDILQNLGGCPALADVTEQTSPDSDNFDWHNQGKVLDALNKWMEHIAVDRKTKFAEGNQFWSSSEYSNKHARHWCVFSFGSVYWRSDFKNHSRYQSVGSAYNIRPVLAF